MKLALSYCELYREQRVHRKLISLNSSIISLFCPLKLKVYPCIYCTCEENISFQVGYNKNTSFTFGQVVQTVCRVVESNESIYSTWPVCSNGSNTP